jgi:hypothetical protein
VLNVRQAESRLKMVSKSLAGVNFENARRRRSAT